MMARCFAGLAAVLALSLPSCDGGGPPLSDSKSNWLHACASSEDCGSELACLCGLCSLDCEKDVDCAGEPEAVCQGDVDALAECPDDGGSSGAQCVAFCSTSGDCPSGTLCYEGHCVPEVEASALACESILDWPREAAEFELEILAALNAFRAREQSCNGMSVAARQSVALHFDVRCAARLHTLDMLQQNYFSVTSPTGEGVEQRLQAAEYDSHYRALAISTKLSSDGLKQTFAEACSSLLGEGPFDAGAGFRDDRWSLIVATPR